METEVNSEDDWDALPSTPAEFLTWVEALANNQEALAAEGYDMMESGWSIADSLRSVARQLRRMGYRPSMANVPDYICMNLPHWYCDEDE